MNKTELIKTVAEKTNAKQTETGVFFENLISVIEDTLAKDEKISITGFGNFERKLVKGREGECKLDVAKGKKWKTEDSFGVSFKAAKGLKETLNK